MRRLILLIFCTYLICCFGQDNNFDEWNENEISQHKKITELAKYVQNKEFSEISKDSLFEKYIYFDYILKDPILERKERRLMLFDTIFYHFKNTIDSIGLKNLDIKPVRFYKKNKIYEPFDKEIAMETIKGEKMYTQDANVFAYYKKSDSENPLGTLLFEPITDKLVSWIMINQGGYKYFLVFNFL